jgi:hypothetical protein
MNTDMTETQINNGKDEYGKCLCFSIPYHELNLIDEMDRNSHMELCHSRSHYLRMLVRRDSELKKQQIEKGYFRYSSNTF